MKKPETAYLPGYCNKNRPTNQEISNSQLPMSEPFKNLLANESPVADDDISASSTSSTQQLGSNTVVLKVPDGREIRLRILRETIPNGPTVLDIRQLFNDHNIICYDPGFGSTASCASAITYIDGSEGCCMYRGYPVTELTKSADFLDVCFLLLYGDLPSTASKRLFERQVKDESLLHNRLCDFINTFVPGAHPMSILASVVSAFASFYADPMSVDHINSWEHRELACIRLIAKMPTVVAAAYKTLIGEPLVHPRADLSYAENFLHMMFATPLEPYRVNPLHAKIIDTFLIIHADHEQNASTSTVRTAGSSLANPYACIATGITSLWGRAHGGANEAVIRMLQEIKTVDRIPEFVARVKAKKVRLMGFGHRIYRNYDPRAQLMRELCRELKKSGDVDDLFELALELEETALKDEYFTSRRLYPNVDFYSGVVMRALHIPPEMFTAMFALGRCVGWLAHWKEMVQEGQMRIARPRQLYLGERLRHVMPPREEITNSWEGRFHEVQAALQKEKEEQVTARPLP